MAIAFDNIDDVTSKFVNTICMYKGEPVLVDSAYISDEDGSFMLALRYFTARTPRSYIKLSDPDFSYRDFNIGYTNGGTTAIWWFRKPLKQYQQGLKRNQVSCLSPYLHEFQPDDPFGFSKIYIHMLRNEYPTIQECAAKVKAAARRSAAFHRDFALSYNPMHEDYTLEFRGKNVGISQDLINFKLTPKSEHLQETLEEVLQHEKMRKAE